jgi:DedD protein
VFKQKSDTAPAATAPADPVQRARTRARQRLIGAIVLLVIGVIGFPLVFETQPRPIPVDIPIEIPKKDALPPLVAPAPTPNSSVPAVVAAPASRPRPSALPSEPKPAEEIITESRTEAGREVAPRTASQSAAVAASAAAEVPRRAVTVASAPARAVASTLAPAKPAEAESRSSADGERARALLEGRPSSGADAQRFVVQVGAFADADAARETRLKVEKLGFKTYTQVAQTPSGSRIRVRVGPFASRGEADAALAKAKTAGLAAVVLTL